MGRAFALARLARGDTVIAIGSNPAKGAALSAEADTGRFRFLRADLSSTAEARRVAAEIGASADAVDALVLAANRLAPKRIRTAEGLEQTFALYYLSRYLLSHTLTPLLQRSPHPVIISIAGVGVEKGAVNWTDPQLTGEYSAIRAQLQAGRANDLLGVSFAEKFGDTIPFVLYHPGFTRSGDLSALPLPARTMIRILTAIRARPIAESIRPLHDFVDHPPHAPLTAIDRDRTLNLSLPTLDPTAARRLDALTEELLTA